MNEFFLYESPESIRKQSETKALKKAVNRVGLVALMLIAAQIPLVVADLLLGSYASGISFFSLSEWMKTQNELASILWSIFEYVVMIGVPLILGLYFCRRGHTEPIPKKSADICTSIAYVMAGIGVCVVANFAASWIEERLAAFGIEQDVAAELVGDSAAAIVLNLVASAVLPALMEELLFRGTMLRLLRPLGDGTALLLSSVLFGLAHGTIVQIPFAFLTGMMFGYIYLKTGNLWLSVLVHFFNNAISVVSEYALRGVSDGEAGTAYLLIFAVMAGVGLLGFQFLLRRKPDTLLPTGDNPQSALSKPERDRIAWLSPTVLMFIVGMLTLTFLSTNVVQTILYGRL